MGSLARALSTALLTLMLLPAVAAAQRERTCRQRGSETLAASFEARFFRSAHGRFYACRYGARPVPVPGQTTLDSAVQFARVRGAVVAYAQSDGDHENSRDPEHVTVYRVDLRTRAVRHVSFDGVGGVGGLVLGANGVAFVLRRQHFLAENVSRVVVWRRGAPPAALDAGDDIDEGSLALGGRTLYWLDAGQPRSAIL